MTQFNDLQRLIEAQGAGALTSSSSEAINRVIELLGEGQLRVASPHGDGSWETHAWVKRAILLYFRLRQMEPIEIGPYAWVDKIPVRKFSLADKVRLVPPATVRVGAFVSAGAVLMPSFVNIGAYVGEGTMVDTWATVGSCAQIGRNVHLSGGVGIGGVLEPEQAQPVIIEDGCFLGSRAVVVEGVHVKRGAVIGAGVVLTASTPILDVRAKEVKEHRGLVPPNAVVIPGTRGKQFGAGEYQVPCALIIGERSARTDSKTSLNEALREFSVPV